MGRKKRAALQAAAAEEAERKKAKAGAAAEFATLAEFIAHAGEHGLADEYEALAEILPVLRKLDAFVGMAELKARVVDQVLFSLLGLDDGNTGMQHVAITGPPGVGKTEVARVLAELYHAMGLLPTGGFRVASRDTLVGGYLGQTAIKTKRVLMEAKGGVIFIDEVYSLGSPEKRDSYSKECLDTICAVSRRCVFYIYGGALSPGSRCRALTVRGPPFCSSCRRTTTR